MVSRDTRYCRFRPSCLREVSLAHVLRQASPADIISPIAHVEAVHTATADAHSLLRHTLQALADDPQLLLDQWELEPLTPLSTPSQSPVPSPRSSPPRDHQPDLGDPLPVVDPDNDRAQPAHRRPRPAPLPSHPGRTRAQEGKRLRRKKARKDKASPFDRKLKSSTSDHVGGTGMLKSSMSASSLPIARGAYVGIRQDNVEKKYWTLDALKEAGFEIRKWDGR